jgi:ATP-binding cassette subfamily B protein
MAMENNGVAADPALGVPSGAPTLADRLRLSHFWFWQEVGGPLPARPPERLQLGGIWHILGYVRYVWWAAIGVLAAIFASAYLGVQPAFIIKHIVNVDIKAHTSGPLFADGRNLVQIFLLLAAIDVARGWFAGWATSRIVWRLRQDVLLRQLAMPLRNLVGRGSGETMVRSINEVGVSGGDSPVFSGIAGILGTITAAVNQVVVLVSAVIAMFVLNVQLTLWSFLLLPIPILLAFWWGRLVYGATMRQYEKLTTLTSFLLRQFAPQRALLDKLLGRQRQVIAEFRAQNFMLTNASIYARVLLHWYDNIFGIVQSSTIGILWLVGGHRIFAGTLSLGTVLAMIALVARLDGPIHQLAELWFSLRSLSAVADRVSKDLEAARSMPAEGADESTAPALAPPYILRGATVADADGAPLATGIDLQVATGEVVTIVDERQPENAGWTWAAALAGWLPLPDGSLTVGGVDLTQASPGARQATVGMVSTEVPVVGLTARRLWQGAAANEEARWRETWAKASAACANAPTLPDLDAPLDAPGNDAGSRFLANLTASLLRGNTVLVTVGEPADLAVRWQDLGCAVLRVQPSVAALTEGERYVLRQVDGAMMSGTVPSGATLPLPPTQPAGSAGTGGQPGPTWSPDVLTPDGPGWWASLGLRTHRTRETGRFLAPFSRLFAYIRRYWVYWLVILVGGEIIATVVSTLSPLLTKSIINTGIGKHNLGVLNTYAILLIVFAIGQGVANICFVTTWVQVGGKRMCGELRDDFFARLMRAPVSFFRDHTPSEITSRAINDVNAIFGGTDQLIKVVTWMIIPNLPGMVILWTYGAKYGLLTLAVSIPFAILTFWTGRLNSRLQQRLFQVVGALSTELRQLSSYPRALLAKSGGLTVEEGRLVSGLNKLIYRLGLVQSLRTNWFATAHTLEGNALTVLLWMVGGLAILKGHLQVGTLTAIMAFSQRYVGLGGAVDSYVTIYGVLANVDRVDNYERFGTEPLEGAAATRPISNGPLHLDQNGGDTTTRLPLAAGQIQTVSGTPEQLAGVRDAVLGLREAPGVQVLLDGEPVITQPLDTWRRSVAWLTPHYPISDVSVGELLTASAAGRPLTPALAMLGLEPGNPELALPAEQWTAGTQPERVLLLLAAMAVLQTPRIVLLDLPEAPEQAMRLLHELRPELPNSSFLSLQAAIGTGAPPSPADAAEVAPRSGTS